MVFFPFIFITAAAFPFLVQAFPAQSKTSSVSPLVFGKPGTLLGRHYTLHNRADPFNDVEKLSQPHSDLGDIVEDHPISRAARFEYSQRKRSMQEDDAHREDFLSDVHPELVPSSTQTSTTTGSAHPAHNTSITLIPRPAGTPKVDKAEPKKRKHARPSIKKSKSASVENV
jgi:hypothetical protein